MDCVINPRKGVARAAIIERTISFSALFIETIVGVRVSLYVLTKLERE